MVRKTTAKLRFEASSMLPARSDSLARNLAEFGQTVIIFGLPRPTKQLPSPAFRRAVGGEFSVPNLVSYAEVLLEFGHESPWRGVASSAPEPDHGWWRGLTSSGLQDIMSGRLAV